MSFWSAFMIFLIGMGLGCWVIFRIFQEKRELRELREREDLQALTRQIERFERVSETLNGRDYIEGKFVLRALSVQLWFASEHPEHLDSIVKVLGDVPDEEMLTIPKLLE